MVQVLLNNLGIQNKPASFGSNFSADNSKTDFQALFDKQNQIAENSADITTAESSQNTESESIFFR